MPDPKFTIDLSVRPPGSLPEATIDHQRPDVSTDPNATAAPVGPHSRGSIDTAGNIQSRSIFPDIPGYEIDGELGRGGMGVVYRARHTTLNRTVAIKMILGGKYTDAVAQARFLIEAEVIAAIQHPHVVQVFEFGRHDDQPYFVLEYVDGGSLSGKLKVCGHFAPRDAATLVAKLADGMAAAHQKGVVHRDLKPANVLLSEAGEPKVTDFGLAKIGASDMTADGAVMGTPNYMSPEQAAGKTNAVGTPADVYSLGAILYEMLTGRTPFKGHTLMATIQQVLTQEPPRPRSFDAKIPNDLETICLKCLEKEPRKRYATADALAADLRAFLDGRPIAARPVGTVERVWKWAKRNPGRAAAIAAGVLVLLGGGFAVFEFQRTLADSKLAAEQKRQVDLKAAEDEARQKQRETKAAALVQALATAEPGAVPVLIKELGEYREEARPHLKKLAEVPIDERAGLHARLALLPDEPPERGKSKLRGECVMYLARCRADELGLILNQFPTFGEDRITRHFWQDFDLGPVTSHDPEAGPTLIRFAAVLALVTPDDPRWVLHSQTVVGHLIRMNAVDVDPFAEALKPVRAHLIPLLLKRYPELRRRIESGQLPTTELVAEASAFDLTANLLAKYTADRPEELAQMAMIVDPRHYTLFALSIRKHQQAIVPILKAEFKKTAFPAWVGNGEIGVAVASVAAAPTTIDILNADAGFDAQAKRQGNAAATLFVLRQTESAWPLLAFPDHGDPSVRSYLTQRLAAIGADPLSLIERFPLEADVSAKRALLIALGDYPIAVIPAKEREGFQAKLIVLYREHPDSGLHAAIDWLLRQKWNQAEALQKIDAELAAAARKAEPARADRDWFVNGEGQTFAVVRGPVEFGMGSPRNEPGRSTFNELAHRTKIDRTFAIATKEVTSGEFLRCRPHYLWLERDNQGPNSPATAITWYDCAMYCNWLSERDGIPKEQWCYEGNKDGNFIEGMKIKPNHLSLTGYRLPTEAEWEYASRGGSVVSRYYGRGTSLLPRYGLFVQTRDESARPVGQMRPNDRGMFDILGNAAEWTEDPPLRYNGDAEDEELVGYSTVDEKSTRTLRGGSSVGAPAFLRSAHRDSAFPSQRNYTFTFRPARTVIGKP